MKKITKAVIPCGGMGTRFLPITKAVPKEILPIIDTPVLGHIIDEAISSGITEILIILGKGKEAIRQYFTPSPELEEKLRKANNNDFADLVAKIGKGASITFAEQKEPKGSADALLYAKDFVGSDAFALAYGDDLIYAQKPVIGQLIAEHEKDSKNILGVQTINSDDITKYGVIDIGDAKPKKDSRAYPCMGIIEKPPLDKIPSRLAAMGRYILTAEVFDIIPSMPVCPKSGEYQLTDSLNHISKIGKMTAYDFEGKRYDMGDKFGSVCATVDYAVRDKNFGNEFKKFLKEYVKELY